MRARGEAAAPLAALGLGALFLGERVLRASSVSWGGGALVALGLGLALVAARRGAGERAAVERVRRAETQRPREGEQLALEGYENAAGR